MDAVVFATEHAVAILSDANLDIARDDDGLIF